MSTVTERVAAGEAFMDENDPGWWQADVERAIDLGTLNVALGSLCVLGQRCPLEAWGERQDASRYEVLASRLSGLRDWGEVTAWAAPLGFQADWDGDERPAADSAALTAEWRRVIAGRRAAA